MQLFRGSLELAQVPELGLDFSHEYAGQRFQRSHESSIVDRPALIDHHLAILPVPGDAARQDDTEKALGREARGAWQHPRGRVPGLIQQVRLDYQYRPHLAGLRARARTEIGEIQHAPLNPHSSPRPSEASASSSATSADVDSRVACEAWR